MLSAEGEAAVDRVDSKLRELGVFPSEVADALKARGIKGEKGNPTSCPIAKFLDSEFPDNWSVGAHNARGTVEGLPVSLTLPMGCVRFIDNFDRGRYTDLHEVKP